MIVVRALRAILLVALATRVAGAPSQFFVAPDGDDGWSGLRPQAEGNDGPFRTLARAQRAVREQARAEGEARVVLAEGEYVVANGLAFGPEDLGTPESPVAYQAAPGARVVLRGDAARSGWETESGGVHALACPDAERIALFHGDDMLPAARHPNRDASHPHTGGALYVEDAQSLPDGLLLRLRGVGGLAPASWEGLAGSVLHLWPDAGPRRACRILGADPGTGSIRVPRQDGIAPGTRGFLDAVPGGMDAPGEWELRQGRLRVLPPAGNGSVQELTVATASPLLDIRGGTEGRGSLRVVGIEFRGSAGDLVRVRQSVSCAFERCRFSLCRGAAVRVSEGHGILLDGCDFRHTGGAAVQISRTERATVRNCWIAQTGEQEGCEGAVVLADATCRDAEILHNLLHDLPGAGIALHGSGHRCEGNRLHHLGLEQGEGAAIMVWAEYGAKPTTVRGNVVADPGGYRRVSSERYAFPDGMSGIAVLDGEGAVVAENVVLRASRAALYLEGRDHLAENNLLVGGGRAHVQIGPGIGFVVRRTVAVSLAPETAWLAGDRLDRRLATVDANLLWAGAADPRIAMDGRLLDWDRWHESGHDRRSMVADPMFRAPQLDCYELLPQSQALRLGFVPLDSDAAGCREDPARRTWPIDDECSREQPILDLQPGILRAR